LQLKVEAENTRKFFLASALDVRNVSEWRWNEGLRLFSKSLKSLMERVKGIEPSYSAWKSGNLVVFSKVILTFSVFLAY